MLLKNFLRSISSVLICVVSATAVTAVSAQSVYPDKLVRIVVPYSPGGTTDTAARLVANKLTENLGKSFIVDNRIGATGTIGTASVARSPADGYTLLANDTTYSMLPNLFVKLPWDHATDLIPITTLLTTPVVLLVPANSPYKTLQEFVDAARKNPGKFNFGSGGPGSSTHFAAEVFKSQAGINITHIPYKGGGDAIAGLISNQIDMLIDAPPTAMPHVKGGKARALAISSLQRIAPMADVPTFAESGFPSYTVVNWFGLAAPKGTPKEIVMKLQTEVRKALNSPDLHERIVQLGAEPGGIEPEAYAKLIQNDTRRWAQLALEIGIKPQ